MTENIRKWLRSCPLVSKNDEFNINFLSEQPMSYTIDSVPGNIILKRYLSGDTVRQKAFVIASRSEYSNDVLTNIETEGFWDSFEQWIESQNRLRKFPAAEENQQIQKIDITSSHYVYSTGPDTARYQIQITITYYQKGDR